MRKAIDIVEANQPMMQPSIPAEEIEKSARLTNSELTESLAMIDQGMREFEPGAALSTSKARQLAHEKLRATSNHFGAAPTGA